MQDDDFDVLVSTADFLKMQSRCHDLEQEVRKLGTQKNELDLSLLEMSARNTDQARRIKRLQESNKYLSLQGLKIAKTVLESSKNNPSTQQAEKQVQAEIQYEENCQACTKLQKTQQIIVNEYQKQKQKNKQELYEFNKENVHLKEQLAGALQKIKEITGKLEASQAKIDLLEKQNKNTQQYVSQLQSLSRTLTHEVDQLNFRKTCLEKEKKELNEQLQNSQLEHEKLVNENTKLNESIKQTHSSKQGSRIWKYPQYVKASLLEEAHQEINQHILSLQELNKELYKLEQAVKQKNEILAFYGEQEKKNITLINQLTLELKRFKTDETLRNNPMEELRVKLNQYFTNLAFKLFDSGGTSPKEIQKTLKSQENAIKKLIEDTVQSITTNLTQDKKKNICPWPPMKWPLI